MQPLVDLKHHGITGGGQRLHTARYIGAGSRPLNDEGALAQQLLALRSRLNDGGTQAQQAGAYGGGFKQLAELIQLQANRPGADAASNAIARIEHGTGSPKLCAKALAQQLRRRHAPARLRVGAQLLRVEVHQAIQNATAIECCAAFNLGQRDGWQRRRCVVGLSGAGDDGTRAKVIGDGAHRLVGQGGAGRQQQDGNQRSACSV